MSRIELLGRLGRTRQTWFALISILVLVGIAGMIGLFEPGLDLAFYLALVGVMLGAAIAVWGLNGWARREESAYVAALSVLQGIGLMLLSYGIAQSLNGLLTALAWTLVFVAPLLRIRRESVSTEEH